MLDEGLLRINHIEQQVMLKDKSRHKYDKILFASGYLKTKLSKNFSNVMTIEDYESHAKAHN